MPSLVYTIVHYLNILFWQREQTISEFLTTSQAKMDNFLNEKLAGDTALGAAASIKGNGPSELYWQLHAESLTEKGGKITLEYLKYWYKSAARLYRSKPWLKCTQVFAQHKNRWLGAIHGTFSKSSSISD